MNRNSSGKIIVLGDIILDSYVIGSASRLSPEAPIPVVNTKERYYRMGGSLNVYNNLKNLGNDTYIIGVTGDDSQRRELLNLLKKNTETDGIVIDNSRPTTVKQRILIGNQQVVRVDDEVIDPIDAPIQELILSKLEKFCERNEVSYLIISDYNKGLITKSLCTNIIQYCSDNDIKVLVDPKGPNFTKYQGAYIVTPNFKEAMLMSNCENDSTEAIMAEKIQASLLTENVLITLSERGMYLKKDDGQRLYFDSNAKEVFDVSGAGDTVIATIAFCLNYGLSLSDSVSIANYAGGIVVGRVGTASIHLNDIKHLLLNETSKSTNQGNSLRIVFTNGCFDILHTGHLKLLKEARTLGDKLVVGLNSDSSVIQLKGEGRPINSQIDRKEMLEALKYVDEVIIFDEVTPLTLINKLKPDVLVKGGDYKREEIVGYKELMSWNGEVKIVELKKGKSSTNTINKIKIE